MAKRLDADDDKKQNSITPDQLNEGIVELRAAQREIDSATGRKRAILKRLDGYGADLKVLALVQRMSKMDEDEAEGFAKTFIRYASWTELAGWSQGDLFPKGAAKDPGPTDKTKALVALAAVYDDGYRTGKQAGNIDDNPHDAGTEFHAKWVVGWHDGQAANAPAQTEGVTTPSAKKGGKRAAAKAAEAAGGSMLPPATTIN